MIMPDFITFVVGLLAGMFLGAGLMNIAGEGHMTIIEKGYGLYCPNTGDFAFTGECEQ
jgi:hypothetical protein